MTKAKMTTVLTRTENCSMERYCTVDKTLDVAKLDTVYRSSTVC